MNLKIWNTALYIRLSREDEGDREESYSVTNQREILKAYIGEHEDLVLRDIYVDDGYSGTNFDRPDFKRMMADIEKGEINCVIVKDLSRFCRNAVDGGYYLDDVFTRLEVRFIAVNNCLDTFSKGMNASTRCITVGVQNVINESVAATTSVNVRSTLDMTRAKGEFIGSFACYGYKKDPDDHHKLIIDENAAAVVRMIFEKFLEGNSILSITKGLNDMGIPCPSVYKKLQGLKYNLPGRNEDSLWSDRSVRRILQNRIYTGDMVQGRKTTVSYKIKKCRSVPPDQWIIVENTHEPIIEREDFQKAQSYFSPHVHTGRSDHETDIFAGILKCSQCRRTMHKKTYRNPGKTYVYYKCATREKLKKLSCQSHTVRRDKLEAAVLEILQKMAEATLEMDEILKEVREEKENPQEHESLISTLKSFRKERDKLISCSSQLYGDWKEGILSKEEYLRIKSSMTEKIESLSLKITDAEGSLNKYEEITKGANPFIENFKKFGKIEKLTRAMVLELIDEIIIYPDNKLEISFKFRDAYIEALKSIDEAEQREKTA